MQPEKPQDSLTKQCAGLDVDVLKVWNMPYPGCNPSQLRPKEFKIVRLENGNLAFCKEDTSPEYIAHEAEILTLLSELRCVPSLIYQTPTAIYTTYIEGRLLPEAMGDLGISACVKVGWQILAIVASVHKKGVVHSDIRPWNFIYGDNARLYLFDFEYAYETHKSYALAGTRCLRQHHGRYLKPTIADWHDTFLCLSNLWRMSNHWVVREVLTDVALLVKFAIRICRSMGYRLNLIRLVSL